MHRTGGVLHLEPMLRRERLTGGCVYYDALTDDARLTLENVLDAQTEGAVVANHLPAVGLVRRGSRAAGADARCALTGRTVRIEARVVVNATGPWTDHTLQALGEAGSQSLIRPTKGVHVLVDAARLPVRHAIVMRTVPDRRVAFCIPWNGRTMIGTTDTDFAGDPAAVAATGRDVDYLLEAANAYFPDARLGRADVVSTYAGLRPLIACEAAKTSDVSREHEVFTRPSGLITIAGGKLTTYRRMAAEVVDLVVERLRDAGFATEARPCRTAETPVGGARGLAPSETPEALVAPLVRQAKLDEATARHLAWRYGTRAYDFVPLLRAAPSLGDRVVAGAPFTWAEVELAVAAEQAWTLDDLLVRRLPLQLVARDQGLEVAEAAARRMARRLGWDDAERARQVAAYQRTVAQSRAWQEPAAPPAAAGG
jgi:glycerol-3-phosphate dehydrogenase